MFRTRLAMGAALALVIVSTTHADVLFNNFGAGDSYVGNAGWTLANGGPVGGSHFEDAVSFSVSESYTLTMAEFGVGLLFGPNLLDITVHDDDGGVPGAILEQVALLDQMLPLGTDPKVFNPPVVATFAGTTLLTAGELYWISISTDATTDSWAAWNENNTGDLGLHAFRENGGPWNPSTGNARGAFRVHGTLIPGPSALAMIVLTALRSRRRRE